MQILTLKSAALQEAERQGDRKEVEHRRQRMRGEKMKLFQRETLKTDAKMYAETPKET